MAGSCAGDIVESGGSGPVGIDTLAATMARAAIPSEEVYRPYLIQLGYQPEPQGDAADPPQAVTEHLGLEPAVLQEHGKVDEGSGPETHLTTKIFV